MALRFLHELEFTQLVIAFALIEATAGTNDRIFPWSSWCDGCFEKPTKRFLYEKEDDGIIACDHAAYAMQHDFFWSG